ncbi:MAG: CpaF family protein [SAR202 cluster bacterium]|nr:CpaF family protein [SAR202 cluster bacterium]
MTQWQSLTKVQGAVVGAGNGETPAADLQIEDRLHQRLIQEIDERGLRGLDKERAREQVERAARSMAAQAFPELVGDAKEEVVANVVNEVTGLGPIEPLLLDYSVSEVMVNAPDQVYYERDGVIHKSSVAFRDEAHIYRIVERIVAVLGRHVDEGSPLVDARLQDGSRVNIIIPPLAPRSPTITIRKFRVDRYAMDDLIAIGTLSREMADFLGGCIKAKMNVVISGGSGSGKTTMLNAFSAFINNGERVVTVEDPIELRLQQQHVVQLEARPPSIEGKGEIGQRDLVRNALRMRPDRIIVGEVRGAEAFDMMQAMNTGHEGSLTTVHANSPRDALARIENMTMMAGFDMPVRVVREQMASALHVIVQLSRLVDGTRKIVQVTEVTGLEGSVVTLQDLYIYKQTGIEGGKAVGEMRATGLRPKFTERLQAYGVKLSENIFNTSRWG